MKNKVIFLAAGLMLVGLLAAATLFYDQLSSQYTADPLGTQGQSPSDETSDEGMDEPVQAPDFTVMDKDGNQVKLSDFMGKPVVVNFWASWCGPCKNEMPAFQTAWETYGEQVQFLMVNLTDNQQETLSSAQTFLGSTTYTFPVYFDTELSGAIAYGVVGIPATYFINTQGQIIAGANSALDYETLEYGIRLILEDGQ